MNCCAELVSSYDDFPIRSSVIISVRNYICVYIFKLIPKFKRVDDVVTLSCVSR